MTTSGRGKRGGGSRVQRKVRQVHRAHKRDSRPVVLAGGELNRDARK